MALEIKWTPQADKGLEKSKHEFLEPALKQTNEKNTDTFIRITFGLFLLF